MAGLSATFAGVAGGFSANLSITSLDPLLGGLTQSAAQLISPTYVVSAAANWYFMIASTFLLTVVGTWVCDRIIEPRLGPWTSSTNDADDMSKLSPTEKKGLLWSGIAFVVMAALIALISIPERSILLP